MKKSKDFMAGLLLVPSVLNLRHAMLKISGSELRDFDKCPEYRRNLWDRRRKRIAEPSMALELGKWAHEILAGMMRGVAPINELPWFAQDAKARALKLALEAWWQRYSASTPWTSVLEVEHALECQLDNIVLQGIPDAIVRYQDKIWHVQHKTVDQSQSVSNLILSVAQSLHECIYAILVKNHLPYERYGGTMLNVVRKMSEKAMREDPMRALHLEWIPIAESQLDRAKHDIKWAVEHFGSDYRRRTSCVAPGAGVCGYYDACWNGISLSDNAFYEDATPNERYLSEPELRPSDTA